MRKTTMISIVSGVVITLTACSASVEGSPKMSFPILDTVGKEIGTIVIASKSAGGVELDVKVRTLSPGTHAMHFHEFGRCDGPDFKSAGGHYNPAAVPHGQHAGDMMNVEVAADGTGRFQVSNGKVDLKTGDLPALMDGDGTALIIHAGVDDYTSQPSGAAGPRVACAIIPAG